MIRVIVRQSDRAAAANVGGPVDTTYRTFELWPDGGGDTLNVQVQRLEAYLADKSNDYAHREVVGVEVVGKLTDSESHRG